ncbi:MAG: hypothetical protein WAM09_06585 [Anaerolineales bacterium]
MNLFVSKRQEYHHDGWLDRYSVGDAIGAKCVGNDQGDGKDPIASDLLTGLGSLQQLHTQSLAWYRVTGEFPRYPTHQQSYLIVPDLHNNI